MAARPLVQVQDTTGKTQLEQILLPAVFIHPIRPDAVTHIHALINHNRRQPYAVSASAGEQTSAESWGTGRAVARIPRVPGGGTHRAGQGAFGNMCRGGRMFAPTKTWRKWHSKVSVQQRRFAICSALAASAVPALVMARGHRIDQVPEIPLVVSNESVQDIDKTKKAVELLKKLNAYADVEKAKDSRQIRSGKGKRRNRRYVERRGPLVIYDKKTPLVQALRNLPGVEVCAVSRLNLLQLAPGGHLGRFIIWTRDAFARLDSLYGTYRKASAEKKDFRLSRPIMANPDLDRLINSDEIQSKLRPANKARKYYTKKKNPLTNLGALVKLNPYALAHRRRVLLAEQKRKTNREKVIAAKREQRKKKNEARKKRKANILLS